MTDLELWQQLKEGQKEALQRIYEVHITDLLRYGKKFSIDTSLVEDCIHDLFVELWKNRLGLGKTDAIKRYLFVALRRKIIRQLDKRKRHLVDEEPQEYQFQADMSIDYKLIEIEESTERGQQLKAALENLSDRQKEVIYLKYFADMDYLDISEVMDINYQSVRNLVFNALKALKKYLGFIVLVDFFLQFFSKL